MYAWGRLSAQRGFYVYLLMNFYVCLVIMVIGSQTTIVYNYLDVRLLLLIC